MEGKLIVETKRNREALAQMTPEQRAAVDVQKEIPPRGARG